MKRLFRSVSLTSILMLGGVANGAQMKVTPQAGLVDAPLHVNLSGVGPGERVTLSVARPDGDGRVWTAVGTYIASASGVVDTDVAPSFAGSYTGVSPHGLWCSALPVDVDKLNAFIAALPSNPTAQTLPALPAGRTITVRINAAVDSHRIASADVTRSSGPAAEPEKITGPNGLRAIYFAPPANAPRKVPVITIAGSGGGVSSSQSALLAAHGHPTLAIGVFGYEDLPADMANVPLERFRDGALWLKRRTGASGVVVMGTSRGSEPAALAASYFPDVFTGAVVLVPSHLTNGALGPSIKGVVPAWTIGGKAIAPAAAESASNDMTIPNMPAPGFVATPVYLKEWTDPAKAVQFGIPVERMSGPLLAIGAGGDAMWPSFIGAEQLGQRLRAHGLGKRAEVHIYPGAGHMFARVGVGGPLSSFIYHPVVKALLATGGLPNDNCEGSYQAWSDVLRFLDRPEFKSRRYGIMAKRAAR